MIYILIIIISARGGVAMQEFNTDSACQTARTTVLRGEHYSGFGAGDVLCVPKGLQPSR